MTGKYDSVFRSLGIWKVWPDFTFVDKETADSILVVARESLVVAFIDEHPDQSGVFVFHTLHDFETGLVHKKGCSKLFDRKPQDAAKDIYFVQCGEDGPIKIGMASDIKSRINDIQSMCPYKLTVIGSIAGGGKTTERLLHKRFSALRLHGEWFNPGDDLIRFIKEEVR
jgi:hypothetical protein